MAHVRRFWLLIWGLLGAVNGIELDVNDPESVRNAAATAAFGLMSWYKGNLTGQIPGLLPQPYYWWEAGAMFMCMIDYWAVTGDDSYNPTIMQAMQFQVGERQDYMPQNQTASMGNDDQAFWAMAALSAAENNFPNPPNPKDPSWLGLAQAVFNEQIARWDDSSCGGGLHWQAITWNLGYNLKNTISNGALMQISARLARYLDDDRYADWATKLWDWMVSVNLINTGNWEVYDNTESISQNCTTVDHTQWTYNSGILLAACATMYNYTEDPIWRNRTEGLLGGIEYNFFQNGIMKERCEESSKCNNDQHSFKAYLSRWMAATTQMAPFTYDRILKLLRSSAVAAAQQCSGGEDGNQCGLKWYQNSTFDGDLGPGQQMAAMEVFLGTLVKTGSGAKVPLTNSTGGTSTSHPDAGFNSSANPPIGSLPIPPSTGDKAGAWFLTAAFAVVSAWGLWFLGTATLEKERDDKAVNEKLKRDLKAKGVIRDSTMVLQLPQIKEVSEVPKPPVPIYRGGTMAT